MGRIGQEESLSNTKKSQLVAEICYISTRFIACPHRHYYHHTTSSIKPHFIDWYHLLGVEEDSEIDVIRKKYHKLALQIHPDKNKHPKAEVAFKLVYEAYVCLSDNSKRHAFNLERLKIFCSECNKIPYTSCNFSDSSNTLKYKACNSIRYFRILQDLRGIRDRFKEEAVVIENCLRTVQSSKKNSIFNPSKCLFKSDSLPKAREEYPVFNPADYLFQGYPHFRTRIYNKPENCWFIQRRNRETCEQGRGKYDIPIFEHRPETGIFKSKSSCIRS